MIRWAILTADGTNGCSVKGCRVFMPSLGEEGELFEATLVRTFMPETRVVYCKAHVLLLALTELGMK